MSSASDDGKLRKEARDLDFYDRTASKELQSEDVFSDEDSHDIQYKTLSWQVSRLRRSPGTTRF